MCMCLQVFQNFILSFVKGVLQFHADGSYYGPFLIHSASHSEAFHSENLSSGQLSCFAVVRIIFLFSYAAC